MKALVWILIVVGLMSAGCGDSSNDMLVASDDRSAPPDTVVTKDELVMEFYLKGNARLMENEAAVVANDGVQTAVDRLTDAGCVRDESGTQLVRVIDVDGRTLEATWLAFFDPAEPSTTAGVVYAHIDGMEYVIPLYVRGNEGPTAAAADDWWTKAPGGDWGPNLNMRTLFNSCASFVGGLYAVCVGQCTIGGVPLAACQKACMIAVAAAYLACIFFTIVG